MRLELGYVSSWDFLSILTTMRKENFPRKHELPQSMITSIKENSQRMLLIFLHQKKIVCLEITQYLLYHVSQLNVLINQSVKMDYIDFDEEVTNEPMSRRESRRKYNRRLDTNYLKVEKDDNSVAAQLVRFVASGVRQVITPRQMLAILVLLALYTVVVLLLTIYSDAAFVYHECFFNLSEAVNMKLGYFHDAKLRMFGVCFAILEILIEANAKFVEKQFRLFKYFIPRSILLFFIATLSEPHPIIKYEWKVMKGLAGNDDAFNNYESSAMIRDELPIGVIRLQMFSSFLL